MFDRFPELVSAAQQRLSFWGLKPEHQVVILANTDRSQPIIQAFFTAALVLGAKPVLMIIPHHMPFQDIPPFAEEALCRADFVVDLQHLTWGYTRSYGRVQAELKRNGAFYSAAGGLPEDVDTLLTNIPSPQRVEQVRKVQAIIDRASRIRVTTALGTDLRMDRGDPKYHASYLTRMYGQVAFAPPVGSAEGVIQFTGVVRIQAPIPEKFPVRLPVRMEVQRGRIVHIDRSTSEGAHLDDWFRSHERPEAYDLAHINLGVTPLSLHNIDNEAVHLAYGGVLMGFGVRDYWGVWFSPPATEVFKAPEEFPNFHIDMHMVNVTYYADDLAIVRDGKLAESGVVMA